MDRARNLIWIDLEMTGLNVDRHVILEIASIITDSQLNEIEHGPVLVINQPEEELKEMPEHVLNMHTKSGLIDKVLASKVSVQEAEKQTLSFFKKYCDPDTALLSGNSVWQDRNFLKKYMPTLVDFCFYRLLDVTAIKEVVSRWYPYNPKSEFEKKDTHRALEDIRESIAELKHLRKYFFVKE